MSQITPSTSSHGLPYIANIGIFGHVANFVDQYSNNEYVGYFVSVSQNVRCKFVLIGQVFVTFGFTFLVFIIL